MNFAHAIFIVLSRFSPHYTDVDEIGRTERFTNLAVAIANSSSEVVRQKLYHDEVELAAADIELGWIESSFARNVHSGQCRPHECDPTKKGFTSISPWQIKKNSHWSTEFWTSLVGIGYEPTYQTALISSKRIAGGVGKCGTLAGSFGLYNTGKRCDAYRYEQAARAVVSYANQIRVLMRTEQDEVWPIL